MDEAKDLCAEAIEVGPALCLSRSKDETRGDESGSGVSAGPAPCLRTAVDLFCGSGAVTAALRRGGIDVLAAVDNDPIACRTYRLNHPDTNLTEKDIRDVDPAGILPEGRIGPIDLLVVCAPCQPFSSQNRKRGDDARANLLLESVKFAAVLKPNCIFFENVPGLARSPAHPIVDILRKNLQSNGYTLSEPRKIDAASAGVPQRRVRCVMVATPSESAQAKFAAAEIAVDRRTVRDAIGSLPALTSGQRDDADPLHYARDHRPIALARLAAITPNGGSRSDLPDHLVLKCHRGRKTSFPDVYGRMTWDDVAPTLTTGCTDLTRGRFAHPEQDRSITLREAALLQTFPRGYRFDGNARQVAVQIGNAVPVDLITALLPILERMMQVETAS